MRKTGGRIVVFTNDSQFYKYLNQVNLKKHKIPYMQNNKIVGVDFYFDKKLRKIVKRIKNGQMLLDI